MTERTSNRDFRPPSGSAVHGLAPQLAAAVREAGVIARAAFGKPMKTWLKDKGSPVSETDIAVDAFLKTRLAAIAPDAGWLSEETADAPGRLAAPRVWIVDPIDGTRAFIAGRPDWTVSAALVENGRPVVAALYAPASEEFFLAVAGAGVTCNGMPIRASSRPPSQSSRSYIRSHCASHASPTARSMPHSRAETAATGTLPLLIFWCTKPAGH
jgi:myo-inositol-1(or 4)-monophosphatase